MHAVCEWGELPHRLHKRCETVSPAFKLGDEVVQTVVELVRPARVRTEMNEHDEPVEPVPFRPVVEVHDIVRLVIEHAVVKLVGAVVHRAGLGHRPVLVDRGAGGQVDQRKAEFAGPRADTVVIPLVGREEIGRVLPLDAELRHLRIVSLEVFEECSFVTSVESRFSQGA